MDILSFLRSELGQDESGHNDAHALRVLSFARQIMEAEGGDKSYIEGCCLLHDCLDSKLGLDNQEQEKKVYGCLLDNGYSAEKAMKMLFTMKRMSFHLHDEEALTLEDKIVRDADRLDALGRVGARRALEFGESRHRPLFSAQNLVEIDMGLFPSGDSTIAHFFDKLLILDRHLYTETAKKMAVPLKQELIDCLRELYQEQGLTLNLDCIA